YIATGKLDLLRGFVVRSILLLLAFNVLVAAGLVLSGNFIAVHLYHAPALPQYVPLFAGLMIMTALNAFLAQVLAGFKHVARRTVITNFVGSPAMMVVAVILIMSGLELRGYILAQAVGAVVVLGLLLVSCWKLMPGPARAFGAPVPSLQRDVGIFSATVSGMNLLEFVIAQSDKVLIGIFLTTRDLGIYAVAAGLVTFVSIILQSVNQIFSPTIAGLHAKRDYVLLGRMHQTLTKWILGLSIPLATVMILFAPTLMGIFGRDVEAGWPILVIGTVGQLVNCATGSVGYLLLMSGNQKRLIAIQGFTAGVLLAVTMTLVPRFGIIGAAVASAISVLLSNVLCARSVRTTLGLLAYNRGYLGLLLPTAATVGSVMWMQPWIVGKLPALAAVACAVVLSYAVFAVVCLAVGLDRDDEMITEAVFRRVRNFFAIAEANA